jgi:hypothetical protein
VLHSVCVLHPFPCSKNPLSIILLTSLNSIVTPETNTSEHDIRWRSRSYFQSTSLIAIIRSLCSLNQAFAAFIFPRICCVHSLNMQLVTVLGAAALLTNTAFAIPQELEKKSPVYHINSRRSHNSNSFYRRGGHRSPTENMDIILPTTQNHLHPTFLPPPLQHSRVQL